MAKQQASKGKPTSTKGKAKAATGRKAAVVKDVDPQKFIQVLAENFKASGKYTVPSYVEYIKTGFQRQLAPQDPDWFYTRMAAVARRVYIRPGVGVGALRKVFGTANYRLHVTFSHNSLAAGGNIRKALSLLQEAGLVEETKEGGRRVTPAGQKEFDLVAQSILEGH